MSSELKNLRIRIKLDRIFSEDDLKLRYTLVDTIEDRGIGEVWDEGIGEDHMEINVEILPTDKKEGEIKSILRSLSLLNGADLEYSDLD